MKRINRRSGTVCPPIHPGSPGIFLLSVYGYHAKTKKPTKKSDAAFCSPNLKPRCAAVSRCLFLPGKKIHRQARQAPTPLASSVGVCLGSLFLPASTSQPAQQPTTLPSSLGSLPPAHAHPSAHRKNTNTKPLQQVLTRTYPWGPTSSQCQYRDNIPTISILKVY